MPATLKLSEGMLNINNLEVGIGNLKWEHSCPEMSASWGLDQSQAWEWAGPGRTWGLPACLRGPRYLVEIQSLHRIHNKINAAEGAGRGSQPLPGQLEAIAWRRASPSYGRIRFEHPLGITETTTTTLKNFPVVYIIIQEDLANLARINWKRKSPPPVRKP